MSALGALLATRAIKRAATVNNFLIYGPGSYSMFCTCSRGARASD